MPSQGYCKWHNCRVRAELTCDLFITATDRAERQNKEEAAAKLSGCFTESREELTGKDRQVCCKLEHGLNYTRFNLNTLADC